MSNAHTRFHTRTQQQRAEAFWIPPGIAEVIGQWLTGFQAGCTQRIQLNGVRCARHTVLVCHGNAKAGCQGVIPLCLGHAGRLCCCCCFVKALQINHSHYTSNTEAGGWIIPRPRSLILCDPVPISHCVREHSALLFCAMKEWRTKGVLSLLCMVSLSLPWMWFIWSIFCVCEGGPICRPHRVSRFLSEYPDLGYVYTRIHLKTATTELLEDLVSQMDTVHLKTLFLHWSVDRENGHF